MCTRWSLRVVSLVLLLTLAVSRIDSAPIQDYLEDDSDYDSFEEDYDVVFDQRQNGTANVRVSVDGVLLALPGPEMSPTASLAGATLLDLFASQLAAGGGVGSDGDSSDEYDIVTGDHTGGSNGSSSTTASSTTSTTTTTTTTVAPTAGFHIASDFPLQTLPASLLGQGLSFLFNTKRDEIPFRVNPGAVQHPKQTIPIFVAPVVGKDSVESAEDSREVGEPVAPPSQHQQQPQAGKKKRKHRRKYKVRMANLLKPLLKRTVLIQ